MHNSCVYLADTGESPEFLSPREAQVLDRLLTTGDGERQIARALSISQNTVHVYIKSLYRCFKVNSRTELMAVAIRVLARQAREWTLLQN